MTGPESSFYRERSGSPLRNFKEADRVNNLIPQALNYDNSSPLRPKKVSEVDHSPSRYEDRNGSPLVVKKGSPLRASQLDHSPIRGATDSYQ